MNRGKHIGFLLIAVCLVALSLSLLREGEAPIPSASLTASPSSSSLLKAVTPSPTPAGTHIPREFFPTPDPSKPRFGPPEVIDDAKAPQWLIKRSGYKDEGGVHPRERPIWVFQDNFRRVVPYDDSRPFCVWSVEYTEVNDGATDILSEEFGAWYHYQVIVDGLPSEKAKMIELETDKSRFKLTVAASEHRPPHWREKMKQRLVQELGLKMEQVELVVAPEKKSGTEEWVEGES